MRIFLLALTTVALSACSLTPEMKKPVLPVDNVYPKVDDTQGTAFNQATTLDNLSWKQMFTDKRLQKLIELALANNRDLRIAALNAEAVRAQYRIQRSERLPSLEAGLSGTKQRTPKENVNGGIQTGGVTESYSTNLGISAFELDLFGRIRALSDAALARYMASVEGRRAAQITLVAGVADAYFAERLAQEQLTLTQSTLRDWRESLQITNQLRIARQASGLDVASAEGQVASAEADIEARERNLAQARNALQLIVGTAMPADLPEPTSLDKEPVLKQLPAGLPSDLLTRRPDILQAEQGLVAANADIGAARAAFFPRVSLTSSLGFASADLGHLFDGGQKAWIFTPQITQPLFQGGKLHSELKLAKIRKSAAIAEYEKAIQTGFREVADSLAAGATYGHQIEAQGRFAQSTEHRRKLSELRYLAGQDSRLELLDAQRQEFSSRQTLLDLRREQLGAVTTLYKALGGGLEP